MIYLLKKFTLRISDSDRTIKLTSSGGKTIRLKNSDMVAAKPGAGAVSAGSTWSAAGAAGSRLGRRASGWNGIGAKTIPCNTTANTTRPQIRAPHQAGKFTDEE